MRLGRSQKPEASSQKMARVMFGFAAAVLLFMSGGCGEKAGVIFPVVANGPKWPPPPDEPRIFYVGKLETDLDLKPEVSGMDALGQAIFGKKEARSMLSPMAVCVDGERLFVADSNAQAVHSFDMETRKYVLIKTPKKAPQLTQPVGVAYDAVGKRLLVSDPVHAAIFVFDREGGYRGQLGAGVLKRPVGLAVHARDGRIFVADSAAHEVVIFNTGGEVIQRLGKRGNGPGEFNFPTYLAVDAEGGLVVSDSLNFRVQLFDAAMKHVRSIGKKGDMPGYFAQPKGVAVSAAGHVYIVDSQFENIQVYDRGGNVLMDLGEEGHGPGQFWLPAGICIDFRDRIWVADSYNRRIQVFDYRAARAETQP